MMDAYVIGRRLRASIRQDLEDDLNASVREALRHVADASEPQWIRETYVRALRGVRYTNDLYNLLEATFRDLPDDGVKSSMARLVLEGRAEAKRDL
jgi:hypothetical protein